MIQQVVKEHCANRCVILSQPLAGNGVIRQAINRQSTVTASVSIFPPTILLLLAVKGGGYIRQSRLVRRKKSDVRMALCFSSSCPPSSSQGAGQTGGGGGGAVLISIVSQVGSVDTNQWRDNSTPSIAWRRESYKEEALHNLS